MLQVISPLKGFAIEASDGRIGTVVDFLFDDASWKVRWLVIDCGTWLRGRKVLIHPSAISREDLERQQFVVALTKAQVEGSPELAEDQPVSQQMENQLYNYYGWDPLWGGANLSAIPGAMASPLMGPPYMGLGPTDEAEARGDGPTLRGADPHLRSVVEVTGYRVHAVDGEIGHIENLMLDGADWSVRYFIVDTRNWWFGQARADLAARREDDRLVRPPRRAQRVSRTREGEPALGPAGCFQRRIRKAASQALWLAGIARLARGVAMCRARFGSTWLSLTAASLALVQPEGFRQFMHGARQRRSPSGAVNPE